MDKYLMDNEATLFMGVSVLLSSMAWVITRRAIPAVSSMFIDARLFGIDLCKKDRSKKVPESQGLVSGTIFLIFMFVFLGLRFGRHFINKSEFPHQMFSENLTSLLSICCMLLLGFADDVLNLKWRYKLILPTIASIPLLMVHYVNYSSTTVLIPNFQILRGIFGRAPNIGPLYYIYMSLLAVFCTNAINIYAGVNGLESGQTLVMALSVAVFNFIEMGSFQRDAHLFSLCLMLPFAATTAALFTFNRYPARVFVGDTFTYFAGMTFAVVGIVGHFSKTVLLFFIPQILNFVYSTPQLFKIIPCPRHRLPRYNPSTDLLEASETKMKASSIPKNVLFILQILNKLKIIRLTMPNKSVAASQSSGKYKNHIAKEESKSHRKKKNVASSTKTEKNVANSTKTERNVANGNKTVRNVANGNKIDSDEESYIIINNLTLINLFLVWFGPMREGTLTFCLLIVQIFGSMVGFFIRYPLANLFYEDFFLKRR